MSGGTQCLCCIKFFPDKCFNLSQMGDNVLPFVYEIARERDVTCVLEHPAMFSEEVLAEGLICIDGVIPKDFEEYCDLYNLALRKYEKYLEEVIDPQIEAEGRYETAKVDKMIKASFNVRNAKNEIIFSIPIKSKTTVIANDSGKGNTWFVEFLRNRTLLDFTMSIDFECPSKMIKPVRFIYSKSLNSYQQETVANFKDPYILVLVNDVSNLSTKLVRKLYKLNNPILVLGRPSGFDLNTGLESIYAIEWLGGHGEESKFILTEASGNKSFHLMI